MMTQQAIMLKLRDQVANAKRLQEAGRQMERLGEGLEREANELLQLVDSHFIFNPLQPAPPVPLTPIGRLEMPVFEDDVPPPEVEDLLITPDPPAPVRPPRSERRSHTRHQYTAAQTMRILEMREQGRPLQEIANELGLTASKVRDHWRIVTGRKK